MRPLWDQYENRQISIISMFEELPLTFKEVGSLHIMKVIKRKKYQEKGVFHSYSDR